MLLGDVLRTATERAPDKRALVFGATALTYRELDQQSERIAGSCSAPASAAATG